MNKIILVLIVLIISCSFVFSTYLIQVPKEDIPSPINPTFVEKIRACGKIDLINRASPNYNPNALINGSLDECDN